MDWSGLMKRRFSLLAQLCRKAGRSRPFQFIRHNDVSKNQCDALGIGKRAAPFLSAANQGAAAFDLANNEHKRPAVQVAAVTNQSVSSVRAGSLCGAEGHVVFPFFFTLVAPDSTERVFDSQSGVVVGRMAIFFPFF